MRQAGATSADPGSEVSLLATWPAATSSGPPADALSRQAPHQASHPLELKAAGRTVRASGAQAAAACGSLGCDSATLASRGGSLWHTNAAAVGQPAELRAL